MADVPPLAIVIPTRDRPDLLARAVASALAGLVPGGEVVVVDDGADGGAPRGTAWIGTDDPRVRIVVSPGPHGAATARNVGAAVTGARVLLFLDDDDEMLAEYPARVCAAAAKGATWGFCRTLSRTGEVVAPTPVRHAPSHGPVRQDVGLRRKVAAFSAGFWIRRDLFAAIGGIDPAQTVDEDTELCARLYGEGHGAFFDATPGVVVRRPPAGDATDAGHPQLTRSTGAQRMADCYVRTFRRAGPLFAETSRDWWFLYARALHRCARAGDVATAQALLTAPRHLCRRLAGRLHWAILRAGARRRRALASVPPR